MQLNNKKLVLWLGFFLASQVLSLHAQRPLFDGFLQERFFFPHVVTGQLNNDSFRTAMIFTNTAHLKVTLEIRLKADDGSPLPLGFEGDAEKKSYVSLELKEGESYTLRSDGAGPLTSGYAVVEASRPLSAKIIISQWDAEGELVTEAGAEAVSLSTQATVPVHVTAKSNLGLVLASPGDAAKLTLRLYNASGRLSTSARLSIPAGQRRALFLAGQLFPDLRDFTGSLSISSTSPIAALAVRQSAMTMTAIPAIPSAFAGNGAEVLASVWVGNGPVTSLTINPRTNKAVGITSSPLRSGSVFLPGSFTVGGRIFVLDLNTNSNSTIDLDPSLTPLAVAANPANNTVLAAVEASSMSGSAIKILVIDLETTRVRSEIGPLVSAEGADAYDLLLSKVKIAVNPVTNVAVVTYGSLTGPVFGGVTFGAGFGSMLEPTRVPSKIFIIDLARSVVRKTLPEPLTINTDVAIDPQKNLALLSTGGPQVKVLDLATDTITRIIRLADERSFFRFVTTGPLAVYPEKSMAVVATFEMALQFPPVSGSSLSIIDLSTFSVVATIPITTRTTGLGSSATGRLVVRPELFGSDLAVEVNPASNSIVVTRAADNDILLINVDSKTPAAAIPAGIGPNSLASSNTNTILVGNTDGSVSVTRLPAVQP
jgi:hypothetical protein